MKVSALGLGIAFGIGGIVGVGASGPALAQQEGASRGAGYLEEVIVTARKREERMQDVPVAVSVFGEAELDRRKVLTIQDLEGLVPNLLIDPISFQSNGATVYIRGLGVQDIDRTFNPAVQVVVDGVTYGSSIANQLLNVVDVERVEVLRGPQGTLFGSNAIGGVVNVTRRKPSGTFGFDVEGTIGSYDRRDVEAALDFPIVDGVLAGRVFVASLNNDGPFRNAFDGKRRGYEDKILVSPQLRFTPSDEFEALFTYDYYKDESDWGIAINRSGPNDLLCLGILFFPGDPKCFDPAQDLTTVNQNTPTYLEVETHAANLQLRYSTDRYTIESITGWSRTDEEKQTDFDSIPEDLFASIQPVKDDYFSQEFRITYDHSERLSFLGGTFAAYSEYNEGANSLYIFALLGFPPGTVEVVNRQQETLSFGTFLTANWRVSEQLTVSAGGRFSWEEKDFIYRNGYNQVGGGFWPDAPGFDNVAAGEESWTEFTPRIAVEYRLAPDAMLYFSYAEGFKSGGFNGRGNSTDTIGPYDPEIVDTFELGIKSEWLDNRVRVNAAAFHSDYKDKQEEIIRTNPDTGATITTVDNAGKAKIQGLELEWLAVLPAGFSLGGTVGYLDAEYDRFVSSAFDVANFVDMRRTPEWQYSLTGQFERQVAGVDLSGLVSYRWTDRYATHLGPRFDGGGPAPLINDPRGFVDSVGFLDASIGAEFPVNDVTLGVLLFGRNLTDEVFLAGVAPIANLWAMGGVNPGRTWGLELRARM